MLVDPEVGDKSPAPAAVSIRAFRDSVVLLRQSLECQLRKFHPSGNNRTTTGPDCKIEPANGKGIGTGTPSQIDVNAAGHLRLRHSVGNPVPAIGLNLELSRLTSAAKFNMGIYCTPYQIALDRIADLERLILMKMKNCATKNPLRSPLQQLEIFHTRSVQHLPKSSNWSGTSI